ncbi:serine/threonine-protein kinase [Streptosporangium sp. NPDC020072]|uniref:serine/threonine-protein kinase n=1 Tax=Streptosporangium sp. NPDC020072 TaxID=3154788 RepID=UPI0034275ED8
MQRGTVVGDRYELVEERGSGGMGQVWKAFDQTLDRHVAVKFIRWAAFGTEERREAAIKRFRREARVTARLRHPGVPIVHDMGTHVGELFLVMEYVDGWTLDDLVDSHGPLPLPWAAAVTAQICAVLTVTHAESLIHRDIKPRNLMICSDGSVKVLDFGIAAILGAPELTKITKLGEGVGTPFYMAPETGISGKASPQSDLYAVGCVLHELLTGTRVFESKVPAVELGRHHTEPPPTLRSLRPDVSEGVEELVLELLAKNPVDRPQDAADVYARLLPFVGEPSPIPGFTVPAPSPDPARMYASVVGRIAETALTGPRPPAPSRGGRVSERDVAAAKERAEELAEDGRFSQAIEVIQDVLDPAVDILGERHPLVFALRMHLANTRFAAHDYRRAAPELERVIPGLAELLSPDHEAVLGCRFNAALCHAALGRYDRALGLMTVLRRDMERALGVTAPLTMELRRQIGEVHIARGDVNAAERILTDLLPDLRAEYGTGHPEVQELDDLLVNLER